MVMTSASLNLGWALWALLEARQAARLVGVRLQEVIGKAVRGEHLVSYPDHGSSPLAGELGLATSFYFAKATALNS
jgi:hypothetical protein